MVSLSTCIAGKGVKRTFPVLHLASLTILFLLSGCITTEIDDRPRAGSYGVNDPLMAALVVRDNSVGFNIPSVTLRGIETTDVYNWGAVPEYEDKAFEIKPGHYMLYLEYYNKGGLWECKGSVLGGEVTVQAGYAYGFSMTNGSIGCSMLFDPPTVVNITSELKKPEVPDVTKTINWTGTLCIIVPVFLVLLALISVAFLMWRNKKKTEL